MSSTFRRNSRESSSSAAMSSKYPTGRPRSNSTRNSDGHRPFRPRFPSASTASLRMWCSWQNLVSLSSDTLSIERASAHFARLLIFVLMHQSSVSCPASISDYTISTTYVTGSFVDSDIRDKVRYYRSGQCIDRVVIRADHDVEAVGAGGFGGYRPNYLGLVS